LESQKSNCSDVFVLSGSPIQPNTKASFLVTGYDNKGSVKRYKMDFGNGVIKESETGNFEQLYETAGTYTARGWIQDTQNTWKGGTGSCEKTVYVSTAPLGRQPETGTPTLFTIVAVISGTIGGLLLARQYNQLAHIKSPSRRPSKKRSRH
jgi:hypothetical protein